MRASNRGRGDTGAIFIESLIAAAIVAMALGTTLQVVADGAARERRVESHRSALMIARSELAEVGADVPLRRGRTTGVAGDFAWRIDVSADAADGQTNSAGALWKVAVAVRSRSGGADLIVLRTLRLGPEA